MERENFDRHPALRFWLIQLPGLVLIAALTSLAAHEGLVAPSTAALIFIGWLVKDLILYPIYVRTEGIHYPLGREAVVGARGEVISAVSPEAPGQVRVRGELWQARTVAGRRLEAGTEVEVFGVDGLTAYVKPAGRS